MLPGSHADRKGRETGALIDSELSFVNGLSLIRDGVFAH